MPTWGEHNDRVHYTITEWDSYSGFRVERPSWQRFRACADEPTTTFYPAPGDTELLRRAKGICKDCSVRKQCLEYALDNAERFGIWGGKSARERMLILRAQRLLQRDNTEYS
jgi:WhiB family redox-sensing transcriptional regulator